MMGTDGDKNDQRGFTSRSAETVRNSILNIADLFYGGDSILDTMAPVIDSMIEFGGRFGTDVEEKLKLGQTAFDGLKRFVASMQG